VNDNVKALSFRLSTEELEKITSLTDQFSVAKPTTV